MKATAEELVARLQENERERQNITNTLNSLTIICPICGKEFACNKRYHTYKAYTDHKIRYYCSYTCFNKRPNPKSKR